MEYQITTCFPLPQLPPHSSAQSGQLSPLYERSSFSPPLQTIIDILYLSLFFPYSTTSFLQQQMKKSPCPDSFCCWGFLWFPVVRSFLGTEAGHLIPWGLHVETCTGRGTAGVLSHLNDYQNWTARPPQLCAEDTHFS